VGGVFQDFWSANIFGTTQDGGQPEGTCPLKGGCGTVFYIDYYFGTETILHNFKGTPDGSGPVGRLAWDTKGYLYGAARNGGEFNQGTVFRLNSKTHAFRVLHHFGAVPNDGVGPNSIINDRAGNLYGTTEGGGTQNLGIVFKIDRAGNETILHNFAEGTQQNSERMILAADASDNLYGTTVGGGARGFGSVYKIDAAGGYTTLYSFTNGSDGSYPLGGIFRDLKTGILYGTTSMGGISNQGTIYELDTEGTFRTLHDFHYSGYLMDGFCADSAPVLGAYVSLYGTTGCGGMIGGGTVFQLSLGRKEKVIFSFSGGVEGGLYDILDGTGEMWGTDSGIVDGTSGSVFTITWP
jgi:uncharacterized repeat protein (TIGR03803 family)